MAFLEVSGLSFTYPGCEGPAVEDVSFRVNEGELVCVLGATGSGKSTLMRLIKRELTPAGRRTGEIRLDGVSLGDVPPEISAFSVGYVMQRPDEQIVTDKVWHELVFGLENMGLSQQEMARRAAETAAYFGMEGWYEKPVSQLSGGQKQLLNLAAVMVMQPRLLILDEPTAQLDPIAASDFIATLHRLNRELGLTVLVIEHHLEELLPLCDRALVLESGRLTGCGDPRSMVAALRNRPELLMGMPSAARLYHALGAGGHCPLSLSEGRQFVKAWIDGGARACECDAGWIADGNDSPAWACAAGESGGSVAAAFVADGNSNAAITCISGENGVSAASAFTAYGNSNPASTNTSNQTGASPTTPFTGDGNSNSATTNTSNQTGASPATPFPADGNSNAASTNTSGQTDTPTPALTLENVYFRYDRNAPDVLRGVNLQVGAGEILCLLGGNGSGKSTLLNLAAGLRKAQHGRISVLGKKSGAYGGQRLYQECVALLPQDVQTVFLADTVEEELQGCDLSVLPVDLSPLMKQHPYDLSGGQQQMVALARVLAQKPKLLLLDEPAKGLDACARSRLVQTLKSLKAQGMAMLIVTHDPVFAADCADRCGLLFRGEMVCTGDPRSFFSENLFYTTPVSRMTRGLLPGCVTVADAAKALRANPPAAAARAVPSGSGEVRP